MPKKHDKWLKEDGWHGYGIINPEIDKFDRQWFKFIDTKYGKLQLQLRQWDHRKLLPSAHIGWELNVRARLRRNLNANFTVYGMADDSLSLTLPDAIDIAKSSWEINGTEMES